MSNNDKPQYDGDFLCLVSMPQPCGNVITRWRVVTLDMNVWLINPGETVNEWHPLPRIDEGKNGVVGRIQVAVESGWFDCDRKFASVMFTQQIFGQLHSFDMKIDQNSILVNTLVREYISKKPRFFNILIY